jgi:hypothetical protein
MEPSKIDLLSRWLPEQSWYLEGKGATLSRVGGFRLDDPDGEVGVECMFVRSESADTGTTTYNVPMTYRGAPLPSAESALIGTGEHGVLGRRWIYDGTRDPVLVAQLLALLQGGVQPQHQSRSDTADPSVIVEGDRPNGLVVAAFDTVQDVGGTSVSIDAVDAGGARQPVTIRIPRMLAAGPPVRPDSPVRLAWVTAPWRGPGDAEELGAVIGAEWSTVRG